MLVRATLGIFYIYKMIFYTNMESKVGYNNFSNFPYIININKKMWKKFTGLMCKGIIP